MIKNFLKNHKSHSKIVPYFDVFFLLRPVSYFAIWVVFCIGMYLNNFFPNAFLRETELFITEISFQTIMIFIGITLLMSAISIINQITDKKTDEINNKLFLLNKGFSIKLAKDIQKFLFTISFLILLIFDWRIMLVSVIITIIGFLYNKEPYEFKKKPLAGLLCNCLFCFFILVAGFIHSTTSLYQLFEIKFFIYSIPYLFLFTAVIILANIPDINGDKDSGRNTFVMKIGIDKSIIFSSFLVLMSLFLSLLNDDPLGSSSIITILPFFLYALFRGLKKDIIRAIRYPIAILNLFTMCIYPYLFVIVIIVFYLSKYYYWHRFDLHYPTVLVDD